MADVQIRYNNNIVESYDSVAEALQHVYDHARSIAAREILDHCNDPFDVEETMALAIWEDDRAVDYRRFTVRTSMTMTEHRDAARPDR